MLVLERRIGERIMIGDDVWIMVVSIKGEKVKIGVQAPKEVPVDREEIRDRLDERKS